MFNFNTIQINCRRNFRVALILVLVSLISAQKFAAQDIFAPEKTDILNRSVLSDSTIIKDTPTFDRLIDKAQKEGRVRVIVGVNAKFTPEGNLRETEAVNIQRDSINLAQNRLLVSLEQFPVDNIKQFDFIPFMAFETDAAALEFMKSSPDVTFIQEDTLMKPTLSESTKQIGADVSWNAGLTGSGYTVAILDTGVDKFHSFLSGKVVSEACYSSYGTDFSTGDNFNSLCPSGVTSSTASGSGVNCSTSLAECDHGTHVAGIAAGKSNITGFNGIAKDSNIIAVQVFSNNTTKNKIASFTSDIILGLQRVYALRSSYNIAAVNMSIGSGGTTANCDAAQSATKAAIDNLRSVNIATVIASGNEYYIDGIDSPACISSAISVGSVRDGGSDVTTGAVDTVSDFSNSASFLTLLAPGETIRSSVPGGGYANKDGTSMATPHVAGAWAIMKQSMGSGATVQQVLDRLNSTGVSITDSRNGITKKRIKVDTAIYVGGNPSLSSYNANWGGNGGNGSFNLNINSGWGWNALSRDSWITTSSGGTGSGTITYTVAANNSTSPRTGTITVAGQTFTVTQSGVSCTPSLSSSGTSIGGGGGSGSFNVNLPAVCTWTASSNSAWLPISSNGVSTLSYTVAPNSTGSTRTGIITVTTPSSGSVTYTVTQSACSSSLSSTTANWGSGGGSTSINVTMSSGCTWNTASSDTSWLTVTSGSNGTGNGQFIYAVAANPNATSRTATITVTGGSTFTVTQDGVSCASSLSSYNANPNSNGGVNSFTVTRSAACPSWSAIPTVTWITVTSGGGTTGNGQVVYSVAENTSTSSRTGTISVSGGSTFTVTQDGVSCNSYLNSNSASPSNAGGNFSFGVTRPAACPSWTAISTATWITVTSGGSGTSGNGTVNYSVAENTSTSSRTGTISVSGGSVFTVAQAAGNQACTPASSNLAAWYKGENNANDSAGFNNGTAQNGAAFAAGRVGQSLLLDGVDDHVSVPHNSNLDITGAITIEAWIYPTTSNGRIVSKQTVSGSSTNYILELLSGKLVFYSYDAATPQYNTLNSTVNIPLNQWSHVAMTISNSSFSFYVNGSSESFSVNFTNRAATDGPLYIGTTKNNAVPNGTTYFSGKIDELSLYNRALTAGEIQSIYNAGGAGKCSVTQCSYSITPTSANIAAAGGSTATSVTAPNGCAWTASSNAAWISITSGSSVSGNGTVNLSVSANTSTSQRTGTVTVAGQTFTVTQDGQANCNYSISPMSQSVSADQSNINVSVTAPAECAWTTTNNLAWVYVPPGASGSGNGTVNLIVSQNSSTGSRSGTVIIAGQNFNITQQGATGCNYSITPTSYSIDQIGGYGYFEMTAPSNCSWSAVSDVPWLTFVLYPSSSSGNGYLYYSISQNYGAQRVGTVTIAGLTHKVTQAAQSFEADVQNRPNGDGYVDSDDIQQIRRFILGLDIVTPGSEFQRADCSPRSAGGDGYIDSDDVQQARRFSLGLDSLQLTSGPTAPPIAPPVSSVAKGALSPIIGKSIVRTADGVEAAPAAFRIDAQNTSAGATLVVPIRVDTVGNEAGYTFSIAFNSSLLTNPQVVIGDSGGDVLFNANNPGQIGFSVTTFTGGTIAAGNNKTLVTVTFTVAANAPASMPMIIFTDQPARRKASPVDPNFPITQPTYTNGTITIGGATAAGATISGRALTAAGRGIANVQIKLTDASGNVRTAATSSFGYYRFDNAATSETYIIEAKAKRYKFRQPIQVRNVSGDIDSVDFTGD